MIGSHSLPPFYNSIKYKISGTNSHEKCENLNLYRFAYFVVMVNVKDIEIKNIDHLGIVAGIIDYNNHVKEDLGF